MADAVQSFSMSTATGEPSPVRAGHGQVPGAETIDYDLIELFFFAYREFVGEPDRILAEYGFGRAHHRVLHFVNRKPGLTIAELLDILQITKQSLNRVLKELIETGFIEQQPGRSDRRMRHLFATAKGRDLAASLARLQHERLAKALNHAGGGAREISAQFLAALIGDDASARIAAA